MQREKRKLNVKQKRREEKIENEISIVYLDTNIFTSSRGSSRYHCASSKQNVVEVMAWLTHQMSGTLV